MDVWAQLWPNPNPNGKVHQNAKNYAIRWFRCKDVQNQTFEAIWLFLDVLGISDDLDKLATTRAIRSELLATA